MSNTPEPTKEQLASSMLAQWPLDHQEVLVEYLTTPLRQRIAELEKDKEQVNNLITQIKNDWTATGSYQKANAADYILYILGRDTALQNKDSHE